MAAPGPWLDQHFASQAGRGAIAVAVVRDGEVTTREYGTPPGSVFRMASLSKVVTAYAVHRSRLDPNMKYDGTNVTLRHLLTHTSGIDDAAFGNTAPVTDVITLEEHFRRRPPHFTRPPGREIVYSNEGVALAGLLLERAAGMPFERVVEERVFRPLGMNHSTFVQPPPFKVVPSGAEGQRLIQSPFGAMVSNAEDMARFMSALLSTDLPYGMFDNDIGGYRARFHTGRSGHESVLYLIPEQRIGLFLVSDIRVDRKRFVQDFIAAFLPPRAVTPPGTPRIAGGTYRPFILPRGRIEYAGNLATDTSVKVDGDTIHVRLAPFAQGQKLVFTKGITPDGYVIRGSGNRFTITGPLFEPLTFQRLRWWQIGRVNIAFAILGFLVVLSVAIRRRGIALVMVLFVLAAPISFALMYQTRSAEDRPFAVASALRVATSMLLLACVAGLWLPYRAWRSKSVHDAIAAACAIALPVFLYCWNLLGWRF